MADDTSEAEAIDPALTELVRFEAPMIGAKFVAHIRLSGLTFAYTDWSMGPRGHAGAKIGLGVQIFPDAVATASSSIVFTTSAAEC